MLENWLFLVYLIPNKPPLCTQNHDYTIRNKAIRDLKSKILIFLRDVISLLARVFILLIDTVTQEVPLKNIWKKLSVQFLRYAIQLLHVKRRTRHKWQFYNFMSNINCGIGVLHVKRQILTYFLWRHFSARLSFYCFSW